MSTFGVAWCARIHLGVLGFDAPRCHGAAYVTVATAIVLKQSYAYEVTICV